MAGLVFFKGILTARYDFLRCYQGMGGRHNYFGLWLSTEFGKGHSKAKPTSTTFGSPRLPYSDEFSIDVIEAWGVGNETKDDEDDDEVGAFTSLRVFRF